MITPNKNLAYKTKTAKREAHHHAPRMSARVPVQVAAPIVPDPPIEPKATQPAANEGGKVKDTIPRFLYQNGKFCDYPRKVI
jgi:hypothetical protein